VIGPSLARHDGWKENSGRQGCNYDAELTAGGIIISWKEAQDAKLLRYQDLIETYEDI